jgi:hypothetical protein
MLRDRIKNEYFEWLLGMARTTRYSDGVSFTKLLRLLHDIEFEYVMVKDRNRAEDGIDLRYRFAYEYDGIENAERYLTGPCSMLEMMVALAIRCEEDMMEDTRYGDRTGQWFWGMIVSLGLGGMTDSRFDESFIRETIDRFLDRKYAPNGKGGLFTIRDHSVDMRKVEIWTQLLWYLDVFRD